MKQPYSGDAHKPLGLLSRAMGAGDYVFVSGTVGMREDGGIASTTGEQTAQTIENVRMHLRAAGLDLDDVVDVTVYLVCASDFGEMNKVYAQYFSEPYPARATVRCDLVHSEHLVEISAIAYRGAK